MTENVFAAVIASADIHSAVFTGILTMYITMLPTILGGVCNMLFTKTALYKSLTIPIDMGITLKDGRRIFGDSKTWIGFFSMMIFCAVIQALWGAICKLTPLSAYNDLYLRHTNTFLFGLSSGMAFGAAYMLFELPNSFIKRRLGVGAGIKSSPLISVIFFISDQIDSMFGVIAVLAVLSGFGLYRYFAYIIVGGLTHLTVNIILKKLKIRRYL